MPLFKSSPKSPQDLVKGLRDALQVLNTTEGGGKKSDKVITPSSNVRFIVMTLTSWCMQAAEESAKILISMKNMLYGTDTQEPQTELAAQLAQEFYNHDIPLHLIHNLYRLDFEAKKDVAQIFNNILRRQIGTRSPTVEYVCTKSEILFTLIKG